VKDGGVLLLAPTGKARVRLETQSGMSGPRTIAQFLNGLDRYDPATGRYFSAQVVRRARRLTPSSSTKARCLTEEQLGALIDPISLPKWLIWVGDTRQLPPIGCGRPFVDIVRRLALSDVESRFPRVGSGYA
jgi:hypothetical protein